jgi:hypothetical protein
MIGTSMFRLLLMGDVTERMFPTWAMLDDEAPSMFWSPGEVAAGALEGASSDKLREAFSQLKGRLPN